MMWVFLDFLYAICYIMVGCITVVAVVPDTCTSTRYRAFTLFFWPVVSFIVLLYVVGSVIRGK